MILDEAVFRGYLIESTILILIDCTQTGTFALRLTQR